MKVLYRLPTPEHGCQGVEVYSNGPDLWLLYKYEDTVRSMATGAIVFERVLAFTLAGEPVSEVASQSYDAVVTLGSSAWAEAYLRRLPPIEDASGFQHYAIYLSNFGGLDVLAKRVKFEERIDRAERLRTLLT